MRLETLNTMGFANVFIHRFIVNYYSWKAYLPVQVNLSVTVIEMIRIGVWSHALFVSYQT